MYRVSKFVAWCAARLLFLASGRGKQHLPAQGPVLLVANHASYIDPMLLGVFYRRQVHFVARAGFGGAPVVGAWMRAVGTIFVDRDAPAAGDVRAMIGALEAGGVVAFFPEGTRSPDGRVHAFKRGLLLLLKKSQPVVVPAGIRGSFAAFPRGRRFPRLFRRCTVTYGAPMTAAEVLADGGLEELRRRVAELCGQSLA